MVHFSSPIDNISVAPIDLPADASNDLSGEFGTISGFGRFNDIQNSEILRYADIQIITKQECAEFFGTTVTNDIVCISTTSGYSTCQGHSGGPLAVELTAGKKILVGATSFGGASCVRGYPAGFTRVSSHLQWINKNFGLFK